MEKNKYRIVTDGEVFQIELFQSWTYRVGWFWLKKVTREQWVTCDNIGHDCRDDDGFMIWDEIGEYNSLEEAKAKIESWTSPIKTRESVEPTWKVVWP